MAQTLFDLIGDPEAAAFAPAFAKDKRRKPSNIDVLNAGIAGIGDLAYDAAGFPVDLSAGLMRALGFDVGQTPMSSDWLKSKATNLGIRPPESADPTLRDVRLGAEMMSGGIDPYATAKGIGMVGSTVARQAAPVVGNSLEGYMARSGLAPRAVPDGGAQGGLLDVTYRGSHKAPSPDFGAPLHDLTGGGEFYPADVYSPKATQYYGTGFPKADKEVFDLAKKVRGNPDAEVTMYRAVPKDAKGINIGDWVTLSKDYAKTHGEAVLGKDYKIIEKKVKAKDLYTNADSIHEFGYHPDEPIAQIRREQ